MAYSSEEDEQDSIEAEAQAAVARYPSIREAYEAVLANRAQYHEQDSMWQYWDDVSHAIWNRDTHTNEDLAEHIVRLILDHDKMTAKETYDTRLRG